MKLQHYFLSAAVLILLDQFTKQAASEALKLGESIVINPFFSLTKVHNFGAAFGFLAGSGGWQKYFFITISLIAIVLIIIWMWRISRNNSTQLSALTLVLSGAIGNLIDRATFGFVVDFIDWHYADFFWPVFNFADIFISIGVTLLLLGEIRQKNE